MKSVLYLIQASDRLPEIYTCLRKRRFLLLSYKKRTSDTTIYAPNTTWAEGRNILRDYVKEHNLFYDYYVYLDEDAFLYPISQLTKNPIRSVLSFVQNLFFKTHPVQKLFSVLFSPLQEMAYTLLEESFELNYPIVSPVTFFITDQKIQWYIPQQIPEGLRFHPTSKKGWLLQTISFADDLYTAIQREAFWEETILPYTTSYDTRSWWISCYTFHLKANYYYRNAWMRNNCFFVFNGLHTDYDRGLSEDMQLEFYYAVCKELAVSHFEASESKQVYSKHIQNKLRTKKYFILRYIYTILSICLMIIFFFPIVRKFLDMLLKRIFKHSPS